jgi:hypothetical protein
MYRKFDVTENLLFAQYFFFFEEVNTAVAAYSYTSCHHFSEGNHVNVIISLVRQWQIFYQS